MVLILGQSVFSWPVAVQKFMDPGWTETLGILARMTIAMAVTLLPGLFAGVATWNRTGRSKWLRAALTLAIVLAVTWPAQRLGWSIQLPYADLSNLRPNEDTGELFVVLWATYASATAVLAAMFLFVAHAGDAALALEQESLRAIEAERGLAEARLQATQAQIEPHFLFNTLANVRRLYRLDPKGASATLRQFSVMLASALPTMRGDRSTVGREVSLSLAYLAVQQIRMGERLTVETDVPARLRDAELPPMILPTLVENAIKHGLAPLPRGGSLRITATGDNSTLRVQIEDSGCGLAESSGPGVGLSNIEARLEALYGDAAFLDLQPNDPGGVTAVVEVPLRLASHTEA